MRLSWRFEYRPFCIRNDPKQVCQWWCLERCIHSLGAFNYRTWSAATVSCKIIEKSVLIKSLSSVFTGWCDTPYKVRARRTAVLAHLWTTHTTHFATYCLLPQPSVQFDNNRHNECPFSEFCRVVTRCRLQPRKKRACGLGSTRRFTEVWRINTCCSSWISFFETQVLILCSQVTYYRKQIVCVLDTWDLHPFS